MSKRAQGQAVSPERVVREAIARSALAKLDEERIVRQMAVTGSLSQRKLAPILRKSQSAVSQQIAAGRASAPDVPEGFSGASPYEVAQRYAIGQITRERLIDELVRWRYARREGLADELDDLAFTEPGSFDDVIRAYDEGLIDAEVYDRVLREAPHR